MSRRSMVSIVGNARREAVKRDADRVFLERLQKASGQELEALRAMHAHKNAPQWKKIAIARAIVRRADASAAGDREVPASSRAGG